MFTTDLLIGVAYVGISLTLLRLVQRIRLPFTRVVLCFGIFIAACGFTHFMEVWTLWRPDYWAAAMIKVVTATASVGTGFYLYRMRHAIFEVAQTAKSSEQHRFNLESLTRDLETRVAERTTALEASEERFRKSLVDMPFPIMMHAEDQEVIFLNKEWERATGFRPEEVRTISDWTALAYGERNSAASDFIDTLYDIEASISNGLWEVQTRAQGKRVWDFTATPIGRLPDGRRAVLSMARDVTQQLAFESQLADAVRARDEFISVASHELKTPITSMKLQVQMAERGFKRGDVDPRRLTRMIDLSSRQLGRLTRLVDDLLDSSRLGAGRLTLEKASHDLSQIVLDVCERFRQELEPHQHLRTLVEPGIHGVFDAFRVEQVLTNLLTNALRYGDSQPIEVRLGKRPDSEWVELSVRDNGPGIAPEEQLRIFERFERASPGSGTGGMGLGLYITRSIVESHRGKIRVESLLGSGAAFIVELPLHAV